MTPLLALPILAPQVIVAKKLGMRAVQGAVFLIKLEWRNIKSALNLYFSCSLRIILLASSMVTTSFSGT